MINRPKHDVKLLFTYLLNQMNFVSICAQTTEVPRVKYTSDTQTVTQCKLLVPPVGNKAPTAIELNIYGQAQEGFRAMVTEANQLLYIHGAKLRHDLEAREHTLHGGIVTVVTSDFPILNTVILSGRTIKDMDPNNEKQFKTTEAGYMIANQTLSVNTGKNKADLFNFYAINKQEDRLRNAELICNFTGKGKGLTIQGKLVTDTWNDQATGVERTVTKIQMQQMTLGPKPEITVAPATQEKKPVETTVSKEPAMAGSASGPSLWGGKVAEEDSPF